MLNDGSIKYKHINIYNSNEGWHPKTGHWINWGEIDESQKIKLPEYDSWQNWVVVKNSE